MYYMNSQNNKVMAVSANGQTAVVANAQPAEQYSASAISADVYQSKCGETHPQQMMKVPVYKHIVHRRPVVYETVSVETSYVDVPIQHNYEQRDYAQNTVQQCPTQQACPPAHCAPKRGCC